MQRVVEGPVSPGIELGLDVDRLVGEVDSAAVVGNVLLDVVAVTREAGGEVDSMTGGLV